MTNKAKSIRVLFEQHEDTGLHYVHSPDVPGLSIYHYDPDAIIAGLPETIRNLFRLNEGVEVSVYPLESEESPDLLGSWVAIPPEVAAAAPVL
mgnify:FL=1|tara:strand:+ start:1615 stop:1893 length:279 start_codon:yes stop_codon:yes gene_type:complete